jgi:hypothetical protein
LKRRGAAESLLRHWSEAAGRADAANAGARRTQPEEGARLSAALLERLLPAP